MATKRPKDKERFTTGQIARHCHVTPETVANWIKAGRLKASATPGGHYRVNVNDLVKFCKLHGFDVPNDWASGATPPSVLIIENDPELLRALIPNLERYDRRVLGAEDAAQAGIMLMKYRPEVVILDMQLPGVDSVQLISLIRKEPELSGARIIILSGYIDESMQEAMKKLKVDYYVNTPPDFDRLDSIVSQLLSASSPVDSEL